MDNRIYKIKLVLSIDVSRRLEVGIIMGSDSDLRQAYKDYEAGLEEVVISKDSRLQEIGAENYIN